MAHLVHWYAREVVDGRIVAGPSVRLACERHLRDLETGATRGLFFDEAEAQAVIDFFQDVLVLENGQPFLLEPWQQFIVGSLYGWRTAAGFRRFRVFYGEIAKGNGKTPMAAGMALYALAVESVAERGVEIYLAATTREQAGICYRDCKMMTENSPDLSAVLDANFYHVSNAATNSYIRPVSSDTKGLDGKRVHVGVLDELHEHPNGLIVQKLRAGVKGRQNALIIEITNSGYDQNSICYQHHKFGKSLLDGSIDNDSWFIYICELDQGDNWQDESVWIKANPNLGVSIQYDYLREQVAEAVSIPSNENIVKRLNFCIWTQAAVLWLRAEDWDRCAGGVPWMALRDAAREYEGDLGLDLSSTSDITAVALLFQDPDAEEESYIVVPYFWCPEMTVAAVSRQGKPYDQWVKSGAMEATDGNVIDYDIIEAAIHKLADEYSIREVAFDPWNATQLTLKLEQNGLVCVPIRQGYASLNEPTKKVEELVASGRLRHGGHPVLRWMALNTMVMIDPAGNKKPAKDKSTEKIDGMSALVTAMARTMIAGEMDTVYEERELVVL